MKYNGPSSKELAEKLAYIPAYLMGAGQGERAMQALKAGAVLTSIVMDIEEKKEKEQDDEQKGTRQGHPR